MKEDGESCSYPDWLMIIMIINDDHNDDRNYVNDHADHDDISVKEDGESCSYPDWFTTHRRYHSLSGTRSAIVIIIIIILVIVIIIIFVIFNVIFIIMMMIL